MLLGIKKYKIKNEKGERKINLLPANTPTPVNSSEKAT